MIRTAGPRASAKPGKGGAPSPCRAVYMINTGIIHGQCARNEFRRKNPSSTAKLFEGRGLGYGTIPQLARNGLGKRPVVRPFCHCETNRRCSAYSLGKMRGNSLRFSQNCCDRYAVPLSLPLFFQSSSPARQLNLGTKFLTSKFGN